MSRISNSIRNHDYPRGKYTSELIQELKFDETLRNLSLAKAAHESKIEETIYEKESKSFA